MRPGVPLTILALLVLIAPVSRPDYLQIERVLTPCWEDAFFCYGRPNGCKGIIDPTGERIHEFPVELRNVSGFYEGLMAAEYPGKGMGFVDTRGRWVVGPRFDDLKHLQNGLAPALDDTLWGFVDRNGEWVIEPQFSHADGFSKEGLARVEVLDSKSKGTLVGFIDRTGSWVIQPELPYATSFASGAAWVIVDTPCWTGNPNNPTASHHNAIFVVYGAHGSRLHTNQPEKSGAPECRWRLVGTGDTLAAERSFKDVGPFSEGLAPALIGDKWGYVNRRGDWEIAPEFEHASPFSEGLAAVVYPQTDRPYAVIDKTGSVVLETADPLIGDFHDGLARMWVGGGEDTRTQFIDRRGNVVIEDLGAATSDFCHGLSNADVSGENGFETAYIDKKGRTALKWTW